MKNNHFPLFIDLTDRRILIVGAGVIAARRARVLLTFGANLHIIAKEISEDFACVIKQTGDDRIVVDTCPYTHRDMRPYAMVLAATDDEAVNREVSLDARQAGVLVNNAGDHTMSDFFFPGIVRRDDMIIGVTGSGRNHKKVKEIRERIEDLL